jgi:hypothetical protein
MEEDQPTKATLLNTVLEGEHGKIARTCFSMPFSAPIAIESEVGRHLCETPGAWRRTAGVLSHDGAGLFAVDQRVWLLTYYALGGMAPAVPHRQDLKNESKKNLQTLSFPRSEDERSGGKMRCVMTQRPGRLRPRTSGVAYP